MQTIDTYILLNKKQPLIIKIFTFNTFILMFILIPIILSSNYMLYKESSSNVNNPNNNMYQRYQMNYKSNSSKKIDNYKKVLIDYLKRIGGLYDRSKK